MINLLPPEEKKALQLVIKKNLVIVLWYMAIMSLLALSLILFLVKLYILQDESYQKTTLDSIKKQYQTAEFISLKNNIQKYNTSLAKADDFYKKQIYFSDVLKNVLEVQRPEGLYFESILVEKNKDNSGVKVSISGLSGTRDGLLIFKNNLEANGKIKNVNFPPANWVKPKDINFNLTLEMPK
ncbi:MAG: hypothetical protein A3F47_01450 [Candidatus Staskawiczbacteria bacterium RIFCSPHIGHO2_12_FULL_38_11]|uniref:Fimbrial assembly protein n=1 Tax=Candidatus Staskawiczbacteria bacterium RIFCSPHIGHO2_12_FULL_38_11 TaxID=1802209 RepID=A0A1G2I795_9BACT|nr:MAG: hypothetical protein A3F47_01450 [Candidatus Staskawiczbacteria bacterium RIFCSPHIGHO2_12_FULL_38_11]